MGVNYTMSLDEAMKVLNLKNGFTESEFKRNYKDLMLAIHPDKVANLNPLAKTILEEQSKKANIAKSIIESYLTYNKHYSNSPNGSSSNSNYYYSNNYHQEEYSKQHDEINRKRENQEFKKKQNYYEQLIEEYINKNSLLNISVTIYYILIIGVYYQLNTTLIDNGYRLSSFGDTIFSLLIIIPIIVFSILKLMIKSKIKTLKEIKDI